MNKALALLLAGIVAFEQTVLSKIVELKKENYGEMKEKGTWIIEYYSPSCPHCKRFAPEFERFSDMVSEGQSSESVLLGKVDCIKESNLD
jgi:protein disulfide-isomerase